ncbi:MAG: hypothetical protein ACW99G_24075 [Candidatus Thorarchaeota archaeon]|jgi:hypothetical protein
MFKKLLRELHSTFSGTEIYIPDAIYPLVKDWMEKTYFGHKTTGMAILKWKGKTLIPYDETDVLTAYQTCPIHIPERILEKSIVIEASLEDTITPTRKEVKPKPVVQTNTRRTIKKRRVSFNGVP